MKKNMCKAVALLMAVAMVLGMSACGSSGDYDAYATAYNRVTANAGMDVDLSATLTMDGVTKEAAGNFKVDNSDENNTILYLAIDMDGEEITQFSDGTYLYTDARGTKVKYPLGEKQTQQDQRTKGQSDPEPAEDAAPQFDTDAFLEEFASFLEAGKIQELGLLSPLNKAAVSQTTHDGNVYTLTVNNSITERYLNTLSSSVMADEEESVSVSDLKDFTYTATVEDDYVTSVNCSGQMTVTVPASISTSGEETSYDLNVNITADFNNPGQKVTISLPSTDGYAEG